MVKQPQLLFLILKTLKVIGQVKTGLNPDAIVYEPLSQKVFTFNGKGNSASVFDAKTAKLLETIPLGGKPEFAVADDLGQIFVNIEDKSEVLTLDAYNLEVRPRWSLKPCTELNGIAIDKQNRRFCLLVVETKS